MQSYYHYLVLFDEITPTLENLTDLVRGELDEGNFGPSEKVRVVWWKTVPYRGKETALKVRVTGPDRDIKLIRANLRAEYGKLGPPAEDFP